MIYKSLNAIPRAAAAEPDEVEYTSLFCVDVELQLLPETLMVKSMKLAFDGCQAYNIVD